MDIKELNSFIDRNSVELHMQLGEEFIPLVKELKKSNSDLAKSISNYLIIRIVTYIESYFKHITRELVDVFGFLPETLASNKEITIALSDIDNIKTNEKITKGRLITLGTNFQNITSSGEMISSLIGGEHFFARINKLQEELNKSLKEGEPKGSILTFDFEKLEELFKIRHEIVHKIEPETEITTNRTLELIINGSSFLTLAEFVIMRILLESVKKDGEDIVEPKNKLDKAMIETAKSTDILSRLN